MIPRPRALPRTLFPKRIQWVLTVLGGILIGGSLYALSAGIIPVGGLLARTPALHAPAPALPSCVERITTERRNPDASVKVLGSVVRPVACPSPPAEGLYIFG